jgi:hypothetical protein
MRDGGEFRFVSSANPSPLISTRKFVSGRHRMAETVCGSGALLRLYLYRGPDGHSFFREPLD